jgi:hypothetical protein
MRKYLMIGVTVVLSFGIGRLRAAAEKNPTADVPHLESKIDPASLDKVENTPPSGFVALFNGKDLSGWKGLLSPRRGLDNPYQAAKLTPEQLADAQKQADADMRKHWSVEDGVIVFDGHGQNLCTDKDYGNFEMWVDWKIPPGGDSGIYIRSSPQVQIWDPANKPAGGIGSGGLYNNQKHFSNPIAFADRPLGQWNRFHIIMVGDKVTVFLNGNKVVDNTVLENYWDRSKPVLPTGTLQLQNHGGKLWFKNIYVKELPRN